MPLDFSLVGQAPRINTPFENLAQILQVRNQQEAATGLREQRQAIADERRQKAEQARLEAQQAAQVRALFSQPQAPTVEQVASVVGPEKAADIFKGFEALRSARTGNNQKDTDRIASLLGGLEALPEPLRGPSYADLRTRLIQDGTIRPQDAPEKYDAAFVAQKRREALTAMQQFEQGKLTERDPTKDLVNQQGQVVTPGTPKPDKLTYGAPQTLMVGGRRAVVRSGSDGRMYDMNLKPIDAAAIAPEPKEATGGGKEQWLLRAGKPVYSAQVLPGDEPLRAQLNTGDTAQDRQRNARTTAAKDFLTRLNELRDTINTKMGPSAGATGYVRRAGAALGMDPDVAEYERIRAAGGRALAVAIMGAQNLSDADANAWGNMLPDARTDKETAKRLTDQVEEMLNGMTAAQSPKPAGAPAPAAESVEHRVWRVGGKIGPEPK